MAGEKKTIDVPKLMKLLELAKERSEEIASLVDEIDALLGGRAGIGAQMAQVRAAFDQAWSHRYSRADKGQYLWNHKVDNVQIKRLIKTLGVDELTARIDRYIRDDDPFLIRARHPFGLLVSGINRFAAPARTEIEGFELGETPSDCKHNPPCKDDVEHTQRKLRESRR